MSDPIVDVDPFFIGWLRPPIAYARFARGITVAVLAVTLAGAMALAWGQRSPGPGAWEVAASTFEGVAYATPYALIRVAGEQPGAIRTILLVQEGKFGASERLQPFDGQPVRVEGTMLHRDERWMLELAPGDAGVRPTLSLSEGAVAQLRRPKPTDLGVLTLRGEIVDSKCFLGAMRPGGGKTHKACAALCLAGGVPPMFVTRGSDGRQSYYLLASPDGGPVAADVHAFVGDPIELIGPGERIDDLNIIKVTAASIRRR